MDRSNSLGIALASVLVVASALGLAGFALANTGPHPVSYTHLDVYKRQFETVHDVDPQLVSDVLERFRGEK